MINLDELYNLIKQKTDDLNEIVGMFACAIDSLKNNRQISDGENGTKVITLNYPSMSQFYKTKEKINNERKKVEEPKNAPKEKEQEKVKINGITIFKNTKCKTWYTRYRKDGKQYYISGKTQKEVSEKLRDALNIEKKQKVIGVTLQQWYKQWLELYKIGKVKDKTLNDYKISLKHVPENILEKNIKQITINDILTILNNIKGERIKQKVYELLSAIFEKALNHKLIKENIFVLIEKPKHIKQKGIALNKTEQKNFIEICEQNEYHDLFKVILYQGLRIGEALALTPQDIDLNNLTININKSLTEQNTIDTTKNKQSTRITPLFNPSIEIIKKYVKLNNQRLFNLAYKTTQKKFRQLIDNNNVNIPKISLHDLRHTFITNCQNENIPEHIIQSWVGHEIGSKVTKNVYTHLTNDANLLNINKLNQSLFYSNSTRQ